MRTRAMLLAGVLLLGGCANDPAPPVVPPPSPSVPSDAPAPVVEVRDDLGAWLLRLGYGNAEVGPAVDRFWLDGPLAITAEAQAVWLGRLARQELPASAAHQRTVRDIVRIETNAGYGLYGKTGWAAGTTPDLGWWVGWVERGPDVYSFALNIDLGADADAAKRVAIGRQLLHRLDVLPAA